MAKRRFTIYYDVAGRKAYDSELTELTASNPPYLAFKESCELEWRLLNSKHTDNPFTGLDGVAIAASMVVDDSYSWYSAAALVAGLTAATAASDITVSGLQEAPRAAGKVILYTAAGVYETVYYNRATASGSNYVLRCADSDYETASFTPSNSYPASSLARVFQSPYVKVSNVNFDLSDKATGILVATLDGSSAVLESAIQGKENLAAFAELKILDGDGDLMLCARCDFRLDGLLDNDSPDQAPLPASEYYNSDILDATLAALQAQITALQAAATAQATRLTVGGIVYELAANTDPDTGVALPYLKPIE